MRFLVLFTIAAVIAASSCRKADELTFDHSANVYFYLDSFGIFGSEGYRKDSILYTFAYEPNRAKDTIFIPVRISGARTGNVRDFVVYVDKDSSTAVEGLHYEPLLPSYTMPAGAGIFRLPLVVINQDPLLKEQSVSVVLRLEATDDLGTEVPALTRAKVVFSSKLEKPDWWDFWPLGTYSQIKHELFIISTGQITLTTEGTDAPQNTYYAGLLTTMLSDPFTWVAKNADKGYVLEKETDDRYYFYNESNPANRILVRKNQQSGRFYFIDENGLEAI